MSRSLACLGLLLCGSSLWAAGRALDSTPAAPVAPERRAEAQYYAQQLYYVATQVSERYVRPVPREELLEAGLKGLYEAARQPVPSGLLADLRHAGTDQEVLAVLQRSREELGNVEALRGHNALLASCRALTPLLDPHSVLVNGDDLRRGTGVDDQQGIGIEVADSSGTGPLLIKTVAPGGPAQEAGIRPGDEIVQVDDRPVKGLCGAEVLLLCNQGVPRSNDEPLSPVVRLILLQQGSREPHELTLERRAFTPETVLGVARQRDNTWNYFLDREHRIAQVRLGGLGNGTALRLREVLTELKEGGLRGLVLDVRWCPGGYLREAVNVAALFLGECTVTTVKTRSTEDMTYPSTAENKFLDFPMVVLVNGETSGGAELIAAALQDHHRALIAGQRTLGKGSIQTVVTLGAPDAGLKLTSGTFMRPSGKNLHRFSDSRSADDWGVKPEPRLDCRTSPELNRQLREWWLRQTLRPGGSTEALPLDNPEADPPRSLALEAVLDLLKSEARAEQR